MARAWAPLQLARHTRPWTLGTGRWSDALKQIAKTDEAALPESVLIDSDAHTYTVYDGYPKAQFHFLIVPRLPLYREEVLENGKRRRVQIHARELDSVSTLLASRHAAFVLECLEKASKRLIDRIHESMQRLAIPETPGECDYAKDGQGTGATWDVRCGFHSIPSMHHLHLHTVSSTRKYVALLTQHYLSFHPTAGYWLPLEQAQELAKDGARALPHPEAHYHDILKGPLVDLDDKNTFKVMPALKQDLEERWRATVDAQRLRK